MPVVVDLLLPFSAIVFPGDDLLLLREGLEWGLGEWKLRDLLSLDDDDDGEPGNFTLDALGSLFDDDDGDDVSFELLPLLPLDLEELKRLMAALNGL